MQGGMFSFPPVVKNLLIINGLFFLAIVVSGGSFLGLDLNQYLALHYYESDYFMPHQFITYLFMHGGFYHLLFNMFALWMFGRNIEMVWGPKKFLIFYMVCGIGAGLLHTFVSGYEVIQLKEAIANLLASPTPIHLKELAAYTEQYGIGINENFIYDWDKAIDKSIFENEAINFAKKQGQLCLTRMTNIPTVGASGAVFGILLAYGMLFPNTEIYIYMLFPIKAKYFVIIYGAIEFYQGLQNSAGDNVAHFAHLGGMIFGYILIRYWKSKGEFYS